MILIEGGQPSRYVLKPSDTNFNTLYTQAVETALLMSLIITPLAGLDATVRINDDDLIYKTGLTTANGSIVYEWRDGLPLNNADLLKVKTSSANNAIFWASIVELMR